MAYGLGGHIGGCEGGARGEHGRYATRRHGLMQRRRQVQHVLFAPPVLPLFEAVVVERGGLLVSQHAHHVGAA